MARGISGPDLGIPAGNIGDWIGSPKKEAVFNAEIGAERLTRRFFCCLFLTDTPQRDN